VNIAPLSLVLGALACGMAEADELVLPQALERGQSAEVAYRFGTPSTGHGFLDIDWSDVDRRVVERRRIPLDLTDAREVTFTLDMRRAVTVKNQLVARLSLDRLDHSGNDIHHENDEAKSFIVPPPEGAWLDYQIIMWQSQTPAGYATLKELAITAGMVEANHRDEQSTYNPAYLTRLLDADLRCYLENIATDFYAPYHKWYDNRPVNWRILELKERYWENRLDRAAFVRAQPFRPGMAEANSGSFDPRRTGPASLPAALLQSQR
jgi:hypothetical protein